MRKSDCRLLQRWLAGVWPGVDKVEDDETPFSISELMVLLITNEQLLTGNKILQAEQHFPHANPHFTPRRPSHSQSNSLNAFVSANQTQLTKFRDLGNLADQLD